MQGGGLILGWGWYFLGPELSLSASRDYFSGHHWILVRLKWLNMLRDGVSYLLGMVLFVSHSSLSAPRDYLRGHHWISVRLEWLHLLRDGGVVFVGDGFICVSFEPLGTKRLPERPSLDFSWAR